MKVCNACGYQNLENSTQCVCGNSLVAEIPFEVIEKDLIKTSMEEVIICPKCGNIESKYGFKKYGKDGFVYCKVRDCSFKFKPTITKKTKIYLHVDTFDLDIAKAILKNSVEKLEKFTN